MKEHMFQKLQLTMSLMFHVLKCELICNPNKFLNTSMQDKYILCWLWLKYVGFGNSEQVFVFLFKNKILKSLIFVIWCTIFAVL